MKQKETTSEATPSEALRHAQSGLAQIQPSPTLQREIAAIPTRTPHSAEPSTPLWVVPIAAPLFGAACMLFAVWIATKAPKFQTAQNQPTQNQSQSSQVGSVTLLQDAELYEFAQLLALEDSSLTDADFDLTLLGEEGI